MLSQNSIANLIILGIFLFGVFCIISVLVYVRYEKWISKIGFVNYLLFIFSLVSSLGIFTIPVVANLFFGSTSTSLVGGPPDVGVMIFVGLISMLFGVIPPIVALLLLIHKNAQKTYYAICLICIIIGLYQFIKVCIS